MSDVFDGLFNTRADVAFLALTALVLPWVLALIYQRDWSPTVKTLGAVAACFVAAAGWLVAHEFSANKWVIYAVVLFGATQLLYYAMRPGLKQFEDRTTL